MIQTEIHPGVCGFKAAVEAEVRDYQFVTLKVQSECDTIKKVARALKEFDAYNEIQQGFDGELHTIVKKNLKGCCSGCVVPAGLFKSMQVAAGLALPRNCSIILKKADGSSQAATADED